MKTRKMNSRLVLAAIVLVIHELAIPVVLFCFVVASPLRALWARGASSGWSRGTG